MSSAILNLDKKDPFADAELDSELGGQGQGYVHIRVQQRNTRKTLTTIQGLADDLDHGRILKACKKIFCCNGCVVEDEEHGLVLQLQGDHRQECADFLVSEGIVSKDYIKLHGA
ncbi:eukaryotic translation initiation factor 1-like [Schistocerca gregaria]|uniref:eukaryotic translation initiation factor 1-like n=1 Tax=Schistocerca gregaria TaxID=7010 RepID=UPI00211DAC57|nr:eukaryotic translation initiation factor 1-like [Schistocerca gregaria]